MTSDLPYRSSRKPTQYQHQFSQEWGKIWGFVFLLAAGGLFLAWPAFFYHGEKQDAFTGQEHWAWNTHSTVAVAVWLGILAAIVIIGTLSAANSAQVRVQAERPQPPVFPDLRVMYGNWWLEPPEGIHPPY
jgi:hypothetical protein